MTSSAPRPLRRGLVLGAGGVLGAAWTIGALTALAERDGVDPGASDVLVGTSAGSVLAAVLSAGTGVPDLLLHQRGIPVPGIAFDHDAQRSFPPLPRPGIGSPRGLVSSAFRPLQVTPMMALSTVLPRGRGSLEPVGQLVDAVVPRGQWTPHPTTWIVAMDYESGRRVAFGREGAPPAALRDAVMASCSIPGWYAPVSIGSSSYVDGGACSVTSVDLLCPLGLDEVVVLAPMASLAYDRPTSVAARLERGLRRVVTRRVLAEVRRLEATGTKVTLLGPGPQDLAAIGGNLMDPRRRVTVLETSLRTSRAALSAQRLPRTG